MGQTTKYQLPYPEPSDPADVPADMQQLAVSLDNLLGTLGAPLVTTLPASPADGQEVYYQADATNGVIWRLRYRAASASTYKWEFVGGPTLSSEVDTSEPTSSSTYVPLATPGPNVTVPLAGDYDVTIGFYGNGTNGIACMSYAIGAAAAVDANLAVAGTILAGAGFNLSTARTNRMTLAAAITLSARYRTAGTSASFMNRWMTLRPIRVG